MRAPRGWLEAITAAKAAAALMLPTMSNGEADGEDGKPA